MPLPPSLPEGLRKLVREQHSLGRQQAWVQVSDLPLTSSVTLGMLTSWISISLPEKGGIDSSHYRIIVREGQQTLVSTPLPPQSSPSLFFYSDTLSKSVHHFLFSRSSCTLTVVSLPETWFYLEKNGMFHTRVYNSFWNIGMQFEREVIRVDFSYVQRKPGELGLKLITVLINFS